VFFYVQTGHLFKKFKYFFLILILFSFHLSCIRFIAFLFWLATEIFPKEVTSHLLLIHVLTKKKTLTYCKSSFKQYFPNSQQNALQHRLSINLMYLHNTQHTNNEQILNCPKSIPTKKKLDSIRFQSISR
jgi:uncharacterized membrane protein (DUF485 family)